MKQTTFNVYDSGIKLM